MNDERSLQPPIWVGKAAGFRAMMAHLRGEPALAVDTESNSLYVYKEQVCLIQISVPGADYLVDPMALEDISDLGTLLADPQVLKVLHGAEYDVSVLHRDFGFALENLFDTMWASRILGWPAHGLAALLKAHFGVKLNKKYQRANWGVRPLPPAQLDYARLDTHYLLPLYEIQRRELDAQDRWPQARHRFSRLVKTRWEAKGFDPEGFWRLSGARDLDGPGLGVLRELYLYREERARAENRPTFRVISNKALVSLAERRPHKWQGLEKIKGVSRRMAKRYGRGMLAAIRRGEEQPLAWQDRPRNHNGNRSRPNGRPSAADQARFQALRAWRNETAETRGVEPDIILTNQILWAVAQRNPRNQRDLARGEILARWQVDEFGDDLLAVVRRVR
ncbi:MAG: HRDC domain-containing protein [Anaerolineae bacterium]|jgi:ribonuclease D